MTILFLLTPPTVPVYRYGNGHNVVLRAKAQNRSYDWQKILEEEVMRLVRCEREVQEEKPASVPHPMSRQCKATIMIERHADPHAVLARPNDNAYHAFVKKLALSAYLLGSFTALRKLRAHC